MRHPLALLTLLLLGLPRTTLPGGRAKSLTRLGLVALASCVLWLTPSSPVTAQTMRAHFIDVGQGAATLVEFPCAAILIDTGGEENGEFNSTDALMDYLETFFARRADLSKTLHSLILTHPHIDHTRGVPAALAKYKVLNAVTNGQETGSGKLGQKALHKKVADGEATLDPSDDVGFTAVWLKDIPRDTGLTNAVIDPVKCPTVDPKIIALWGAVEADPGWGATEFANLNNHSVVIRIDFGQASLLVPGDLEEKAIRDLVARYSTTRLLDVDVYQVGHHGSHNGTTEDLLRAITPDMAVIAMGSPSREISWTAWAYGHPRRAVVDLLHANVRLARPATPVEVATAVKTFTTMTIDRAIYATGWDGTVVLEADVNGTWTAHGALPTPAAPTPALINVNAASVEELSTLPMIGHVRASAIVRYRTEHGLFTAVDDLQRVNGIGPGTLNAIRNLVTTGR